MVYIAFWVETATRQPLLSTRTAQAQRAGALMDAHQDHAHTANKTESELGLNSVLRSAATAAIPTGGARLEVLRAPLHALLQRRLGAAGGVPHEGHEPEATP
eukprot:4032251-Alexandrium_andersonii.AAC.1